MIRRRPPWLWLLAVALAGAAVNTGNNLLYLCLSLLLALGTVHSLSARRALRSVRIESRLPEEAVRGEPFLAGLAVTGRFPLLPRAWVSARLEGLPAPLAWSVCVPGETGRGVASIRAVVSRRGVYDGLSLVGSTSYPLAVFESRLGRVPAGSLVVLPAFRRLSRVRVGAGAGPRIDAATPPSGRPGGSGGDLHSLREYAPPDDARRIEWRSSARAGRLMVREFERQMEPGLDLVLDPEADGDAAFEPVVERCAALLDFARRAGLDARLLADGPSNLLEGAAALRHLAGARPAPPGSRPGWAEAAARRGRPGARVVVLSADPTRATPLDLA